MLPIFKIIIYFIYLFYFLSVFLHGGAYSCFSFPLPCTPPCFLRLSFSITVSGCLEILLIRMCRAYNSSNNTMFFDGKFASPPLFKALGCDDLVNAVFELAKNLSRLQLSDEEMALFSAAVLLAPDRPWLTESQQVQKLQEKVYVALQHSLHMNGATTEKLDKMVSKLPQMKSICNLHVDKLEFFRLVHPETAYSFPPLYREVFGSEIRFPDSTNS